MQAQGGARRDIEDDRTRTAPEGRTVVAEEPAVEVLSDFARSQPLHIEDPAEDALLVDVGIS